jgi:hypothetical protein
MGQIIRFQIGAVRSECFALVQRCFEFCGTHRRLWTGLPILLLAAFIPTVAHAGIISEYGWNDNALGDLGVSIWQEEEILGAVSPAAAAPVKRPAEPKRSQSPIPGEPKSPQVDFGLDAEEGTTTSEPVVSGGGAAQPGHVSANLYVGASRTSQCISPFDDSAVAPPSPCELLDPPKMFA